MTGKEAYQEYGEQGFLQNPFLVGPHHDARNAAAWWREFDEERSRRRNADRAREAANRLQHDRPGRDREFMSARYEQIAQARAAKPRTTSEK